MRGAGLLEQTLPARPVTLRQLRLAEGEEPGDGPRVQLGSGREQFLEPVHADHRRAGMRRARERPGRQGDLRRLASELQRDRQARLHELAGQPSEARIRHQVSGTDEEMSDERRLDARLEQAARRREPRSLRDAEIAGDLQEDRAGLSVLGQLLMLLGRRGERRPQRRERARLPVAQLAQILLEGLPLARAVLAQRREDGHYLRRPMVASVPREKTQRCAANAIPQAIATHCTQNRSGEKRRLSTAQTRRPEIITSAWMVSRTRWLSRTRNPLPAMADFLPRNRARRLPAPRLLTRARSESAGPYGGPGAPQSHPAPGAGCAPQA